MATQGHAHVVHLHGDGVASEQTFVQQFDLRAFDKAQFQQTAFQLDRLALMVTMGAHLNDDAAIAASGLAQLDGVGQFYARTGEAAPRRLRVSLTLIIRCEGSTSSRTA